LVVQILSAVLVNEGLDKEVLIEAHTLAAIPILIGSMLITKFLVGGKIMKCYYPLIWLGIPCVAIDVYTYYDYTQNGDKNTFWLSFVSDITGGLLKCAWWILDSGQIAMMVDENINPSHFTAMQTYFNISNALPYFIGTMTLGFMSYYIVAILGTVYTIATLPFLWKYFKELDSFKKEDFVWIDMRGEAVKKLNAVWAENQNVEDVQKNDAEISIKNDEKKDSPNHNEKEQPNSGVKPEDISVVENKAENFEKDLKNERELGSPRMSSVESNLDKELDKVSVKSGKSEN